MMPQFKYVVLFCGIFLSGAAAQAADLCVSNLKEFNQNKDQLPAVFRNLDSESLMWSIDSTAVTAGIKIYFDGNDLRMRGGVWTLFDLYNDDNVIKKVCYGDETLVVTLENGKKYNAKIKETDDVIISGQTFKLSNEAKFAGIIEKVQQKIDNKRNSAPSAQGIN
ncbi:hypothetical protein D3C87_257160 [compost metagenome]